MSKRIPSDVHVSVPSKKLLTVCLFFAGVMLLAIGSSLWLSSYPDKKNLEILKNGTPAEAVIISMSASSSRTYDWTRENGGYRRPKDTEFTIAYRFTAKDGKTIQRSQTVNQKVFERYLPRKTIAIRYDENYKAVFEDYAETFDGDRRPALGLLLAAVIPLGSGIVCAAFWKPFSRSYDKSNDRIEKHYTFPSDLYK
ncbi:MAG: hypothetical protein LBP62_01795 [Clostridiales bacterium]|jgi:hypothetical protein|nr:hypothetical protein [Clostridiales bacterium]